MQAALSALTRVTFGNGPALVAGFEDKMDNDNVRLELVLNFYSLGLRKAAQNYVTHYGSDATVLRKIEQARKPVAALQRTVRVPAV